MNIEDLRREHDLLVDMSITVKGMITRRQNDGNDEGAVSLLNQSLSNILVIRESIEQEIITLRQDASRTRPWREMTDAPSDYLGDD